MSRTTPARVAVVSKPQHVAALRSTWRKTAQHKVAQYWRFTRLFVIAFVGQIGTQLVTTLLSGHVDVTQLDRKFIVSLVVGAAEVTWRQRHPALTASEADSAPGVTIVPGEVDPGADVPDATQGDLGEALLGVVGAILVVIGVILLAIGALHNYLSVGGLIALGIGVVLYYVDDHRTRGRRVL